MIHHSFRAAALGIVLAAAGATATASAAPIGVPVLEEQLEDAQRRSLASPFGDRQADAGALRLFREQFDELRPRVEQDPAAAEALSLIDEGLFSRAVRRLDEAGEGGDPALRLELRGIANSYRDALGAAESDFTAALRLRPGEAGLLTRRAIVRGARGDKAGAASDLEAAIEADPGARTARQRLGLIRAAEGRFEEAIDHLAPVLPPDAPRPGPVHAALAEAYLRTGQAEKAAAVLAPFPQDALSTPLLYTRASAAMLSGAYETAAEGFAALGTRGGAPEAARLLHARSLARGGRLGDAIALLSDADDASETERTELGLLLVSAGRLDEAATTLAPLMTREAPSADALGAYAEVLMRRDGVAAALAFLGDGLGEDAAPALLSRRASLKAASRDYEGAIEDYRRVLEAEPGRVDAMRRLSLAASRAGDAVLALSMAERVAASTGAAPDLAFYGAVLEDEGRWDEALAQYSAAIEAGGGLVAYNNSASIMARQGDFAQAEALAKKAYDAAPDLAAVQHNLGWITANLGDLSGGRALLERAVGEGAQDPALLYRYGLVLFASGDEDEGRTAMAEARALDPEVKSKVGAVKLDRP